jgi:hypothetical protein
MKIGSMTHSRATLSIMELSTVIPTIMSLSITTIIIMTLDFECCAE